MALHQPHQRPEHRTHYVPEQEPQSSRTKWIFAGFLVVAGFFLFTEHRAHVYGALPYLLVLACPLMHLFHGHGSHHGSHGRRATPSQATGDGNGTEEDDSQKGQS